MTLIEMLITLVIGAMILTALGGVVYQGLQFHAAAIERNELSLNGHFAMERMVTALRDTRLLLLPFNDNDSTAWDESVRNVLAVSLPLSTNLDHDGFPDADDDRDGLVDEDLPNGRTKDLTPGIYLIDDDGDGSIDEGTSNFDDDENNSIANEDPINGLDDDNDNTIDEDPGSDMNGDGCPGICGVDDDGDGQIDEGDTADDDEDGFVDEDWYNPLVFYMDNTTLKERTPVPWDEDGNGNVGGRDFISSDIADNVSLFRVERISRGNGRATLVDITLELTGPNGDTITLHSRTRVGGGS